jgi:hypothetical protein
MPYRDLDAWSCANDNLAEPAPKAHDFGLFEALPLACTASCAMWIVIGLSLWWLFN